jgi:isopentenyldiphosphate isomerase
MSDRRVNIDWLVRGEDSVGAPGSTSPIDVVDAYNNAFGTIERGDALRAGANFRTVHVLVFNPAGDLLVQRLADSRERHPGLWGSSVAGYLHAGEDYDHAARRRLYEELAVTTPVRSLGVLRMDDEQSIKFVGVYSTGADHYRNQLPTHIADLEWRDTNRLRADMTQNPDRYTETFRQVFEYWRASAGEQRR